MAADVQEGGLAWPSSAPFTTRSTTQPGGGATMDVLHVVREREAAQMLGVSVAALRRWRHEGRGPIFVRMERCVGYRVADLDKFLAAKAVFPRAAGEGVPA